ncbi:MAG: hypothetical protein HOP96_11505 [Sphingomonas sp.]|nr:hypothetical protein [Sphingomonas sp.]
MPATEMIVMVAAFSALALVAIQLLRLAGVAIRHKTVRRVVDRDPVAAERLISELDTPKERAGDDRLGIILVALGAAMIGASVVVGDIGDWTRFGIAGALFPLVVGAALLLRHYAIERAKRRGGAQ